MRSTNTGRTDRGRRSIASASLEDGFFSFPYMDCCISGTFGTFNGLSFSHFLSDKNRMKQSSHVGRSILLCKAIRCHLAVLKTKEN